MKLYIDTSKRDMAVVRLHKDHAVIAEKMDTRKQSSQVLLPLIESIMVDSNYLLSDLTDIQVHTGPGSYMGIRVGVSVAQVLGFLLHIPVNGHNANEKISISYEKDHFIHL